MLKKLIDNKLLLEEHFTYSATTRGKEISAGKIAMINSPVTMYNNSEYEFGYMPYPGETEDDAYICNTISCLAFVAKRDRTEKEKEAVNNFLDFFSTTEGQTVYIDNTLVMSNVKNVPSSNPKAFAALQDAVDRGHVFEEFKYEVKGKRSKFSFVSDALSMLRGEKTAQLS